MSENETSSESWLTPGTILKLVLLLCALYVMKKLVRELQKRWFAYFLGMMEKGVNPKIEEVKKDIFAPLASVTSHDPELRKQNALKILEIGVGTGLNFSFYPDGTRLVVVDPNPHFRKYYNDNRKKFPNIHSEEINLTTAEEMDMVESNSVDVVVSTIVMCSVNDMAKVLKQILRVLVPGGIYIFYDHIAEFDTERHGTRRKIQSILTFLGIWQFIFDGCRLNRDPLAEVQRAGFSKVKAQRFYTPGDHFVFQLIKPSIKGVAEK